VAAGSGGGTEHCPPFSLQQLTQHTHTHTHTCLLLLLSQVPRAGGAAAGALR
jgi:hypothetical protein